MSKENEKSKSVEKIYEIYARRSNRVFGVSLTAFWEKYHSGVFESGDQFKRHGEKKWMTLSYFVNKLENDSSYSKDDAIPHVEHRGTHVDGHPDSSIAVQQPSPVEPLTHRDGSDQAPGWWSSGSSIRDVSQTSGRTASKFLLLAGVGVLAAVAVITFLFLHILLKDETQQTTASNSVYMKSDLDLPDQSLDKLAEIDVSKSSEQGTNTDPSLVENSENDAVDLSFGTLDSDKEKSRDTDALAFHTPDGALPLSSEKKFESTPVGVDSKEAPREGALAVKEENANASTELDSAFPDKAFNNTLKFKSDSSDAEIAAERTLAVFEFYRINHAELRTITEKSIENIKETEGYRTEVKLNNTAIKSNLESALALEFKIETYRRTASGLPINQAMSLRGQIDLLGINLQNIRAKIAQSRSLIPSLESRIALNEGAMLAIRARQREIATKNYEHRINLLEGLDLFGEVDQKYHEGIEKNLSNALVLEPDFVVGHLIYGFSCFRLDMMDEVRKTLANVDRARNARSPEARLLNENFFIVEEEIRLFLRGLVQCDEGGPQSIASELSRFFQVYKKHPDFDMATTKWIQAKVFFKLGRSLDAFDCLKAGVKTKQNNKRVLRNAMRLCREESANSESFLSLRASWAKTLQNIVAADDKLSWMEIAKTWIALNDRDAALFSIENLERINDQDLVSEISKLKAEADALK